MKSFFKSIVTVGIIAAVTYFAYPHVRKLIDGDSEASKKPPAPAKPVVEKSPGKAEPKSAVKPAAMPAAQPDAGKPEPKALSEAEKVVLELYPMPEVPPLIELTNNWEYIPDRAFPRELVIHADVAFDLKRDGNVIGQRSVPAGSIVQAKGMEGSLITISPQGSDLMFATIEMDETSLKESIQEGYDIFVENTRQRILALREAERNRMARMSAEERGRPVGWTDGSAAVFEPMRASLSRGELEDWELSDAKRWRWLGKESVEGVTYDAGLAYIEVETIFGVFPKEVKALMQNGKLVKWVDPVSGQAY